MPNTTSFPPPKAICGIAGDARHHLSSPTTTTETWHNCMSIFLSIVRSMIPKWVSINISKKDTYRTSYKKSRGGCEVRIRSALQVVKVRRCPSSKRVAYESRLQRSRWYHFLIINLFYTWVEYVSIVNIYMRSYNLFVRSILVC
jgi:hypothetical protein